MKFSISDFCSRHSFDKGPIAPHPKRALASSQSSSSVASNIHSSSISNNDGSDAAGMTTVAARYPNSSNKNNMGHKRPIHELSEEQQLQAAIRASMLGADENNDNKENDDMDEEEDEYVMEDEDDENNNSTRNAFATLADNDDKSNDSEKNSVESMAQPKKKNTMADEFAGVKVGDEPPAGRDVARIQIRLPDGSKLVRRFNKKDLLEVVYAFCVQTIEDAGAGRPFELLAGFPPKDLYPKIAEGKNADIDEPTTIESCGLSGGSISVRWKEQ